MNAVATPRQAKAVYPDLTGRSVVITGGATGIGAALTEAFAGQDALVAFLDIDASAGQALEKRLEGQGCRVVFHSCDINDTVALQAAIQSAAAAHGPVTVLLNNAANDTRHSLDALSPERFDALVSVNLRHAVFAAQAVAPMMKASGGGSVVNFGSIGWMMASGGYPVYAAMKAAVHGLTRGLARDLGQDGIRVNTLVPGWVMTEKQLKLWVDNAAREKIAASQCLPGSVLPAHIANMALFLASDVSAMCSAQNFIVDGGWV